MILLLIVISQALCAQFVTIAANPDSQNVGRPVFDAVQQVQNLTNIPINYEDLQYNAATDVKDIGYLMTPAQQATAPNKKVLVPKGGTFSVNVPVDSTEKLPDAESVGTALNTVIAGAQAAGIVPGTFSVDSSQPGAFFVAPSRQHDSNGNMVAAQAALNTPVSISVHETLAQGVAEVIFQQTAKSTGAPFSLGSGAIALMQPTSKVTLTASNEPAKYVLARLLAAVYGVPSGNTSRILYAALFEPQYRYYVLNIGFVATPVPDPRDRPNTVQPPPGNNQEFGFVNCSVAVACGGKK